MEINKISQLLDSNHLDSTGRTKDKGFQQIFEQEALKNDPLAPGLPGNLKTEMLDQSDKVLDLLENFVQQLNDSTLTLRDIEPITGRIENEVCTLESQTEGILPKGSDFEQFIKDLSVTAQVAVLKFKRGDYI